MTNLLAFAEDLQESVDIHPCGVLVDVLDAWSYLHNTHFLGMACAHLAAEVVTDGPAVDEQAGLQL